MQRHCVHTFRRRAIVAPLVAISAVLVLLFCALSIDIGFLYDRHVEMQGGVDASALAGASALLEGWSPAQARATEYAGMNRVDGKPIAPAELTMTPGHWEGLTRTFVQAVGWGGGWAGDASPNAMQVAAGRVGIPLHFGSIAGVHASDVGREAIALVGSGRCLGIWGLQGVTGDGDLLTDSYDSRVGGYGVGNIRPNGDVCSNTDIDLAGSVGIHGDAMYGDGYALTTSGNAYEIWGIVGDHCCPITPPSFADELAAASVTNDNGTIPLCSTGKPVPFTPGPDDIVVDGGCKELTLGDPGGNESVYYFTSMAVSAKSKLFVVGPTKVFIDGDADFAGGGIINATQDPRNLIIYSSGSLVHFRGNSTFYGAVIAPNAKVWLDGTSEYFGTIIGDTVDIDGNSIIHVDEAIIWDLFGTGVVAPILVR